SPTDSRGPMKRFAKKKRKERVLIAVKVTTQMWYYQDILEGAVIPFIASIFSGKRERQTWLDMVEHGEVYSFPSNGTSAKEFQQYLRRYQKGAKACRVYKAKKR